MDSVAGMFSMFVPDSSVAAAADCAASFAAAAFESVSQLFPLGSGLHVSKDAVDSRVTANMGHNR